MFHGSSNTNTNTVNKIFYGLNVCTQYTYEDRVFVFGFGFALQIPIGFYMYVICRFNIPNGGHRIIHPAYAFHPDQNNIDMYNVLSDERKGKRRNYIIMSSAHMIKHKQKLYSVAPRQAHHHDMMMTDYIHVIMRQRRGVLVLCVWP